MIPSLRLVALKLKMRKRRRFKSVDIDPLLLMVVRTIVLPEVDTLIVLPLQIPTDRVIAWRLSAARTAPLSGVICNDPILNMLAPFRIQRCNMVALYPILIALSSPLAYLVVVLSLPFPPVLPLIMVNSPLLVLPVWQAVHIPHPPPRLVASPFLGVGKPMAQSTYLLPLTLAIHMLLLLTVSLIALLA